MYFKLVTLLKARNDFNWRIVEGNLTDALEAQFRKVDKSDVTGGSIDSHFNVLNGDQLKTDVCLKSIDISRYIWDYQTFIFWDDCIVGNCCDGSVGCSHLEGVCNNICWKPPKFGMSSGCSIRNGSNCERECCWVNWCEKLNDGGNSTLYEYLSRIRWAIIIKDEWRTYNGFSIVNDEGNPWWAEDWQWYWIYLFGIEFIVWKGGNYVGINNYQIGYSFKGLNAYLFQCDYSVIEFGLLRISIFINIHSHCDRPNQTSSNICLQSIHVKTTKRQRWTSKDRSRTRNKITHILENILDLILKRKRSELHNHNPFVKYLKRNVTHCSYSA